MTGGCCGSRNSGNCSDVTPLDTALLTTKCVLLSASTILPSDDEEEEDEDFSAGGEDMSDSSDGSLDEEAGDGRCGIAVSQVDCGATNCNSCHLALLMLQPPHSHIG